MRILPEMCPRTTCPFSSFTRKVALGRVSSTSPCICMVSSLDINRLWFRETAASQLADRETSLEIRLLQQTFILMRHHVSLHLRHEIHRHNHNDQQRRAAKIERHVEFDDQKLGQ